MCTVFFDVDTQIDFMLPAGALYVPGAEKLVPTIARLNAHAWSTGSPLISTMDAHAENDVEFLSWPHHCVAGCLGQRKVTPVADRAVKVSLAAPCPDVRQAGHVILEKVTVDCFTNPHLAEVLTQLEADRYVVYGVVTEICVQNALFGLLKTGKPVTMLSNAVKELSSAAAETMLAKFTALGGEVASA
ncbi:MAG: cysteine hydrolase family protein [Acidobacteria bacterium]|nr:cysteine hydrolase family protein [Acidobacteriota bacterium]